MIYFELFYTFFYIGLFTFGGGYAMIPLIEEQAEAHQSVWGVSPDALGDFIGISESTPGPFALNIATFIGCQTAGPLGALCSTIGVVLPSFIIILLVAVLMKKLIKNKYVQGALNGVRPIVIGLITATAITFFIKMTLFQGGAINSMTPTFDNRSFAIFLIVGGISIIYKRHKKKSLNPILILAISAVLGILVFELFKL